MLFFSLFKVAGKAALCAGLAAGAAGPARAQLVTAVANAASFEQRLAPNTLATAFIKGFPDTTAYKATVLPLPQKLQNTILRFDGVPAGLLYADGNLVNFYIPATATAGDHTVAVEQGAVKSPPLTVTLKAANPGTFTYLNQAGIMQNNATWQLIGPDGLGVIARPNDDLVVYGTGFGNGVVNSGGVTVIAGTQAYLTMPDGATAPLFTYGTYETGGFVGLQQTNVHLPASLPTGVAKISVCKGDSCSTPVAFPIWDGTSSHVNQYLFDINNQNIVGIDPMTITNTTSGNATTVTPQSGLYVGNVPSSAKGEALEARVNSGAYYNWRRTIANDGTAKALLASYVPMMGRTADPDNIDPATGKNWDSLDMVKFLNGAETTRVNCGHAYVFKWNQTPIGVFIPKTGDQFVDGTMRAAILASEKDYGYAPGTLLYELPDDPDTLGVPGVRVRYGMLSTSAAMRKGDACTGPLVGEFWIGGTPITASRIKLDPSFSLDMTQAADHELSGHLMGYGTGNGTGHSPLPDVMDMYASKPVRPIDITNHHRITNAPYHMDWDEYQK